MEVMLIIWMAMGILSFIHWNMKFNKMPFVRHCTIIDNPIEYLIWLMIAAVMGPLMWFISKIIMQIAESD